MLDPHVISDPQGFDSIYADLRDELKKTTPIEESNILDVVSENVVKRILNEFGGMGGSAAMSNAIGKHAATGKAQSSHWSSAKFNTKKHVELSDDELDEKGGPKGAPHSIDFNKWNPWPFGDEVMPFDKAQAQDKKIANDKAAGIETDKKSVNMTGHGELKFATVVKGTIPSDQSYDVQGGKGEKWEIKQINSTKTTKSGGVSPSTSFRLTIRSGPSYEFRKRMTDITNQLVKAFRPYSSKPDIIDKELGLKMGAQKALDLIKRLEDQVIKGNFGSRDLFGWAKKTPEPGLVQLLGQLSGALKKNSSGDKKKDIHVLVGDHEIKKLTVKQYINIAKILGVDPKTVDVGIKDKISAELSDDVFENPAELKAIWNAVSKEMPHLFTHSADFLVVVDEALGYFPIRKENISKFVRFNGSGGKELNFEFRKKFLK
ncbi:MAG: hypothetical protein ACW99G_10295 [Candidatus Thorarchaeota archaeon]|jgi:hypothetical protein